MPQKYTPRYIVRRKPTKKVPKHIRKYVHKVADELPEKKQYIYNYSNALISVTNGTPFVFQTGIIQGVADTDRIGAKIKVHEIEFSCVFQYTAQVIQSTFIRAIVLIDKQTNGALVTTGELLTNITTNRAITSSLRQSLLNQYTILYDKVIPVKNTTPVASQVLDLGYLKFNYKFKRPHTTVYYPNASSGTIADIDQGAISLLLFSGDNNVYHINTQISCVFTDA